MSKIDKLQILGIRSFDNQRSETIQFLSPLTLVVGYNGSGKTTIIECLKYATTGMQPPNTKGGAFIHDPKLCGEREVMAQVKLSFKAASGAKMVATRSLQLTVKKATRTLKTLEGQLLMVKDGERTAISSRVAELDMILPQYLGVSAAVLDNVIFCHQDESLWPMSTPVELKKKFDEIFEASKYTKAIENIKQLRKKHNEDLGKFKIMEQHAKEDKDRAVRAEKKSKQLHTQIESMRTEVEELGRRIQQAAELANKAWSESESYAKVLGALEGKRIEAQSKETTIKDLQRHLKVVSESDEWLESTLEQFQQRLEQYGQQKMIKQEDYVAQKEEVARLRGQLEQNLADRGKHEQDKAEYERQVDRRKQMVKQVASIHQLRGYDDLTDNSLIDEFVYKIRRLSKTQNAALERARSEADSEKREVQSLVNRLTERKSALQNSKIESKKQIALNDREAGDYQRKVDQISVDEGSSAIIESRFESVTNRLKEAHDIATKSNWDKAIRDSNSELRSYEDSNSHLNNELIQGTKRAGETAKLAHLKQELRERQRSLEILTEAHGQRITQLLGSAWQAATVEAVHRDAIEEATRELTTAERARDLVVRELEQVQYKQNSIRAELGRKKSDATQSESHIREAIERDPAEYQEALDEVQASLNTLRENSGSMEGLTSYFQKMLKTANYHTPVCRACERPFKGENDTALVKFKARIEGLIKKAERDADPEEVRNAEAAYQSVLDAGLVHDRWQRLVNTELPSLSKELDLLSGQREILLAKIEEHDKGVERKQLMKKDLEQISRTVASIAKCEVEITAFESQIKDLSAKQTQDGMGRTLEDIQEEISSIAENMQMAKRMIERLTADRDQSRMEISGMDLELRDLKNELNTTSFQLEKKRTLVARVDEFRAMNQKQRDNLVKVDNDIDKLEPEIATANAKYDDAVQRASTKEKELQQQCAELLQSVNALDMLNEQIKSYVDRDGANQLLRVKREIKNTEQEIGRLETELGNLARDINKIEEQLRDSETTQRQYSDNLRYRQESRALEKVRKEIQLLASQNAEVDRDRFAAEYKKLSNERTMLEAQAAGRAGEMKSKDMQLMELVQDYDTDFKDAGKRYREAHIRVETTKAAVEDLGRYGGALDKAIMKYHGLKMEEINRIIEDLWQKTYQGTDIDTVLIRSDKEGARANQNYNYRVCMVKQDVEMDMRGRCSAGQKVLASILIRIALAECFGTNCGVIALDEPTTNLDRDNIRSLAESLHEIIKIRQQQSNFQLIIITHDEEFLRAMRCEDFTDYYYRVSRNEKITSQIERQAIQEVT